MTVCIAAIAADRKGVPAQCAVIASDRMVTVFGMQEFEHEVPKLQEITPRVYGLMAGDALRGSTFMNLLRHEFNGNTPSVIDVAQFAGEKYAESRLHQIDAELFRVRGITISEFYREIQQKLVPQIAFQLDAQVSQYNYNLELLIAGVDASGAHVFTVTNPGGSVNEWGQIGSAAIGSGGFHATQSLIAMGHTPAKSLPDAIMSVYAAKRRAEVAPGVGHDTDLVIIEGDKVTKLDAAAIQELDKIYTEKIVPTDHNLEQAVEGLAFYKGQKNGKG